ncbi:uncharacterized protein LOC120850515, partial [Ixodes scapularis]|uniref:uncharacterized protein LOC120850515 n=1 Tax=Ixodes scapularis TaxID=6945 RepID=UPI001A9FA2C5
MRRDNLFCRVSDGGLGLPHLFIRQLVSRFLFLRDQKHPFLREVIQDRLAYYLPDFIVSTVGDQTCLLVGYLKEVVDAFQFLSVRFSKEYLVTVSRKKLTRDLVKTLFPMPIYRSMFSNVSQRDVLRRVKKMPIPPAAKTFFFKLHCYVLPTKVWLREKGIFVPWSTNCTLCKTPETIEHIFIHCWDAIFFWDILQRTLKKDIDITPYSIRFLPVSSYDNFPYDIVMLLALYSMWKSRLDIRNENYHPKTVRLH